MTLARVLNLSKKNKGYRMNYMFTAGFLGTKAPFFMDFVTMIVSLLPFLILVTIWLVRRGYYRLHRILQFILFTISVIVVGWFEYGVRVGGGFSSFVEGNSLPRYVLIGVLVFHIIIATVAFLWWAKTIYVANKHYLNKDLPGIHSIKHISDGKRATVGIFLTSLTGIWVYLLLFLY